MPINPDIRPSVPGTVCWTFTTAEATRIAHAVSMFALDLAIKAKRKEAHADDVRTKAYIERAEWYQDMADRMYYGDEGVEHYFDEGTG